MVNLLVNLDRDRNKVITTMMIRQFYDHTYCVRAHSITWGFGKSCTIVHGITSEPENQTCSIDIFSFRCNLKGRLTFETQLCGG